MIGGVWNTTCMLQSQTSDELRGQLREKEAQLDSEVRRSNQRSGALSAASASFVVGSHTDR